MSIPKINEKMIVLAVLIQLLMVTNISPCQRVSLIRWGLSEFDKKHILDLHNKARQTIALGHVHNQPTAANMLEMHWDEGLAASAQNWALCAVRGHDPHRHTAQYLVGQNVAKRWTTKTPESIYDFEPNFEEDAIHKWFKENQYYHFGQRRQSGLVGHYTQLVWADSDSVGCGYAFYYDPTKGFTKNYVCNYGPSGNFVGESPYQSGYQNCYNNGLTYSKKYPGLCDKPTYSSHGGLHFDHIATIFV